MTTEKHETYMLLFIYFEKRIIKHSGHCSGVLAGPIERMDYVLREGSMESSYISAVTSHTAYWTNYDVSHFILNVLYPDLQPPTSSSKPETSRP